MALNINNLVDVSISLQAASVSRATYGVPAVIAEFATSKTTVAFDRARFYGSMTEVAEDGWVAGDSVYKALSAMFAQPIKPAQVMLGRIDSGDASLTAALNAIQAAETGWYAFTVVGITTGTLTFSTELITGNSVTLSIAGTTVGPVAFTTDHATTMAAIETAIESALTSSVATVSVNSIAVVLPGTDISPITGTVTGGATQATVSATYALDETDVLAAAAWAETQTKEYGITDADVDVLDSGSTTDLLAQLGALNYTRTFLIYSGKPHQYAAAAWLGKELPKDPGSSSFATKTLVGVEADDLSQGQFTALKNKNGNGYVTMGGNSITLYGTLVNGDPIETTRNMDYAISEIQADLLTLKLSRDIIPYNDNGIGMEEGTLKGTGARLEAEGIAVPGTFTTAAPKFSQVPTADITARVLKMPFNFRLQYAIVRSEVTGVVTP